VTSSGKRLATTSKKPLRNIGSLSRSIGNIVRAHNNLGLVWRGQGKINDAIAEAPQELQRFEVAFDDDAWMASVCAGPAPGLLFQLSCFKRRLCQTLSVISARPGLASRSHGAAFEVVEHEQADRR
jgi:hypothetical protein